VRLFSWRDGILEIEDHRIRSGGQRLFETLRRLPGTKSTNAVAAQSSREPTHDVRRLGQAPDPIETLRISASLAPSR